MYRWMSLCLALAASLGWSGAGMAQPVYRCGESYSQQPCPGGKAIQADDPRTAAQRSQTSEAARRDAQTAEAMEKARLKEEAKPAQAILPPARLESAEQPPPAAADAMARKPAHFTAVSPAKKATAQPGKKKKKAKKKPATV